MGCDWLAIIKRSAVVKKGLSNLLVRQMVSHAVLLTGPPGSGKRTWGTALAQALLCSERVGAEPCLHCLSCRQFQSGNHPLFINLEPRGRQLKVKQIREVRHSFYLEGGNTVCLIHQAEKMTAVACSSCSKYSRNRRRVFILSSYPPNPDGYWRRFFLAASVSRCIP